MGPDGILTGMARQANLLNRKVSEIRLQKEMERKDREIARKRRVLEANIEALRNEFESVQEELGLLKATEALQAEIASSEIPAKKPKK
jgi:circadian clock protein KaiC